MGVFSDLLKTMRPRNGRLVLEDGTSLNRGDALRAQTNIASRTGYAYRGFWFGNVPAATTYYFQVSIPAGIDLFGFTRTSTVRLSRLDSTFVVRGTPGATQDTESGFLFDERNGEQTAQSSIIRIDTLTGHDVRSPPMPIIPPATGPELLRSASDQTEAGFQPAFNSSNLPGFIYENPSPDTAAELYLQLTWQELPSL